jgi:hypothetical protein
MQWDQWLESQTVFSWELRELPGSSIAERIIIWHHRCSPLAIALLGPGAAAMVFVSRRDDIAWVVGKVPGARAS